MPEDPDTAEPAPPDKSLSWFPFAGAIVVAVIAVVVVALVGSGSDRHLGTSTDADASLQCPKTYEIGSVAWVPIGPAGVNGKKRLVPDTKPGHATVCRYPTAGNPTERSQDTRLSGRRTLGGDLRAVTRTLSKTPGGSPDEQTCRNGQGGDSESYLMGLTFPTGVIWVSAPGDECLGSTNGEFHTASVRPQLRSAYHAGAWIG